MLKARALRPPQPVIFRNSPSRRPRGDFRSCCAFRNVQKHRKQTGFFYFFLPFFLGRRLLRLDRREFRKFEKKVSRLTTFTAAFVNIALGSR